MGLFASKTLRQGGALILLAIPFALLTAWLHPQGPIWQADELQEGEVRVTTVLGWPDVLWLDARSRDEFEEAHIPGALLMNEEDWDNLFFDLVAVWDPDVPVVVYCGGGQCQASHAVAERLRSELGSENIFILKGGWPEWRDHR